MNATNRTCLTLPTITSGMEENNWNIAGAKVVTIQDLLGHNGINTTERYCCVSNLKVMRDHFKAMEVIMQRTARGQPKLLGLKLDKTNKLEENKEVRNEKTKFPLA